MTRAQFESAVTGSPVQILVRVESANRSTVRGELLARVDDSTYARTGASVELYLPADAAYVMGSSSDVKPGAAIFVYGTATTHDRADVKRVVVVTPYVTVR